MINLKVVFNKLFTLFQQAIQYSFLEDNVEKKPKQTKTSKLQL